MAKRKTDGFGNYIADVTDLDIILGSLPPIRGTWYFVDPTSGSAGNNGLSPGGAFSSVKDAYEACADGAGDGIVLMSAGTTSAATTSYLKKTLTWAKSGITVIGLAAPTRMYGRARIANVEVTTPANTTIAHAAHAITRETGSFLADGWEVGMTGVTVDSGSNNGASFTIEAVSALSMTITETFNVQAKASVGSCVMTSYVDDLVAVSGSNNLFENVHIGNWSSHAKSLGGLKVSGNRNAFIGCHIVGAGHATPGAVTTARSLLIDGAQETTFERCTIGTDTVLKAAANAEIVFDGGAWRTAFYDCDVICYSATAGKGAIKSMDATALSGIHKFTRCRFSMWNENGMTSDDDGDSLFIGTAPTSGAIWMDASSELGWAAWDATAGNDRVYTSNGAVHAATGGIALLTS